MSRQGHDDTTQMAGMAHLRLLATTDLHMNILPYDYMADRPANMPGLARIARAVRWLRARAENTLLLDNGDFLQGNPMGDYFALERSLRHDEPHPMIAAMNSIGYDAGTVGNHEFNYGLDLLQRALRDASHDLVSANLLAAKADHPADDTPLLRPYTLLRRDLRMGDGTLRPATIGVIGFAPPQTVQWDGSLLCGRVTARDVAEAARYWVPLMRAEGADLVIALAHTGIDWARPPAEGQENAARGLARVAGIDALILGHLHKVFPSRDFPEIEDLDPARGTIAGVPAVMAGHSGQHLGVIDLWLSHTAATGWAVARARPRALRLTGTTRADATAPPMPSALAACTAAAHAETLAHIRAPLGTSDTALHSYFAVLGPTQALTLVAAAQRAWFAQQPESAAHAHLPVLSAVAPFKAGGQAGAAHFTHVPPGTVTQRHVFDLYPFPNRLAALIVTGAELETWLEAVARQYNAIAPGAQDAPLLPATALAYNFDMIDGLEYRFDLSAERRLARLAYQGQPVARDARFVILTNSYRAAGGGGLFPSLPEHRHIRLAQTLTRRALAQYVQDVGHIARIAPAGGWQLDAAPGSTAVFDTAPAAIDSLGDIAHYRPEIIGQSDTGFLRLRLKF